MDFVPISYDRLGSRFAWLGFLLVALFVTSCSTHQPHSHPPARPEDPGPKLVIAAAASLQGAFREIGTELEERGGLALSFSFASSGALQKQIENGAPVDVFASAGTSQMETLQSKQLMASPSRNFASNELVLIAPLKHGLKPGFGDLSGPKVTRIAIGNPKTVPAGHYAQQTLISLGVWKTVEPRLVPAEDVRQVLEYVARGEVDAGLVYRSDLYASESRVSELAQAPAESHDPILYPIAIVRTSAHQALAQQFLDAVCGPQGQAILHKYGFQKAP